MKRNKDKRIFAKILIRYIICTVVFSIPLWVFADRYVLLIEAVTGSGSFYDIGTVIVTNLVLAFVITLVFMLRAARLLDNYLDTAGIPDPDLMIRTSGELRLSNFLLWQMAYTEFYFTDVAWPDFNKAELIKAIEKYNQRDRRYGGVKEE